VPADPAAAHRAQVLAEAQAQLDAQEQRDLAGLRHENQVEAGIPGLKHLHAMSAEAVAHHDAVSAAGLPAGEADMAARVAEGEEAAIAEDDARAKRDDALVEAREPGSPLAAEARAAVAEIDRDEDDAMTEAIAARMAAAAVERDRHSGDVASARADAQQAQDDLAKASADLSDADAVVAKLEADMRAAGEQPPG
jgi:hypothetical protein